MQTAFDILRGAIAMVAVMAAMVIIVWLIVPGAEFSTDRAIQRANQMRCMTSLVGGGGTYPHWIGDFLEHGNGAAMKGPHAMTARAVKTCADCQHWRASERWFFDDDNRECSNMATEIERVSSALCCASFDLSKAPTWMRRLAGGGAITKETDGLDCPAFEQRENIL